MTQMIQDQNRDAARMLLAEIAKAIVDHPEAVEVESIPRNEDTLLRLRVAPADVGKLIGKQGRTARSVRAILGALSMKQRSRYALDIVEDDREDGGENSAGLTER